MNPFKFGTIVENEFFTDRKEESEILKQKPSREIQAKRRPLRNRRQ